jgi:hypothetical protein
LDFSLRVGIPHEAVNPTIKRHWISFVQHVTESSNPAQVIGRQGLVPEGATMEHMAPAVLVFYASDNVRNFILHLRLTSNCDPSQARDRLNHQGTLNR